LETGMEDEVVVASTEEAEEGSGAAETA